MINTLGTIPSLQWKSICFVLILGLASFAGCAGDASPRFAANQSQENGRVALIAAGQTSYRYDPAYVTPATGDPGHYPSAGMNQPQHGDAFGPPTAVSPTVSPAGYPSTYPMNAGAYSSPTPLNSTYVACEASQFRCGVQCENGCCPMDWSRAHLIPWDIYGPGEYVGPPRTAHVPEYRLRVDDTLEFVYRLTGETMSQPYRFNRGDELRIESLSAPEFDRALIVQPDGTITVPQFGQITAAGRTVEELRNDLESRFRFGGVLNPGITVTPTKVNTTLEELRNTVDGRFGNGGQSRQVSVTPEGTIQLPAIGSVFVQGLNLTEVKSEIEQRYASLVQGIELTPILIQRAPRYVYVVGEVRTPGRYELVGPTTAMQGITLAGGWNPGECRS